MRSKLSTEERIQIVLLFGKFESFNEVQRQWGNHFSSQAPDKRTISSIVTKFKQTGSVLDLPRSGRSRSVRTQEIITKVENLILDRPNISVSVGARELDISPASFHRIIKELGFRPFKPCAAIELSDDDFDRRHEFCQSMVDRIEAEPAILNKIIWSDESEFKLNGTINRHNCRYWASTNPHELIPRSQYADGVMVWCGITPSGIIGPYFFEENVNGPSYLKMLEDYLWPRVKHKGMYFQQDGAPAHYSLQVREWLDKKFPNRWIGRRGPIEWPARSPDLSPPDFFLWGYLKNIVYKDRPSNLTELRNRIATACAEIDTSMCDHVCKSVEKRFERCRDAGGAQQF